MVLVPQRPHLYPIHALVHMLMPHTPCHPQYPQRLVTLIALNQQSPQYL